MKKINRWGCLFILVFSAMLAGTAPAQSGGSFLIEKSVIASGGGQSTGASFTLDATAGEPVAGTMAAGGNFSVASGFWGGAAVASNVSVSGRVLTPDGIGLKNAIVTLTDQNGVRVRVITSSFGAYLFSSVPTGGSYLFSISSKRFRFQPRSLIINADLTGNDFVGIE